MAKIAIVVKPEMVNKLHYKLKDHFKFVTQKEVVNHFLLTVHVPDEMIVESVKIISKSCTELSIDFYHSN